MPKAHSLSLGDFVGPSLTPGYRPQILANPAAGWLHDQPWFSWWDVEAMRRDPQILFGLSILRAPLDQAKWETEADSPEVADFVERTLRRFWDRELGKAARHLEYGSAAGEVLWRHDAERDTVEFDRLKELTVFDAKPLELGGRLWGLQVAGVRGRETAGVVRLPAPRFFWSALDPEIGRAHGRGRLAGPWAPWMEKTGRHGAVDSRRQWFLKCAYDGGVMYHPVGTIETAPGVYSTCQDYARELLEKKENGGMLVLPNVEAEEGGKKLWEHVSPKVNGSGKELVEYPKTLDEEILVGMGIPVEVARAAESGSGWSGRSIPFIVYLTGEDRIAKAIFQAVEEHVLKPGVEANFGPGVKFGVKLKSFVPDPQEAPDQSQGQDGAPGGGEDRTPPRRPPQGPGGVNRPVRLSAADPWTRYVGPHGGRGWKHSQSGEVVYGDKPGGGKKKPTVPELRAKVKAGKTWNKRAKAFHAARKAVAAKIVDSAVGRAVGAGASAVAHSKAGRAAATAGRAAKWLAKRLGQEVWDAFDPETQQSLIGVGKAALAVDHFLERHTIHAGQSLALEVAKERGLGLKQQNLVSKVTKVADAVAQWTVNIPAVHAGIEAAELLGGPAAFVAAKVGYYVPVASLAYVGYSTVRDPMATVRAARNVFRAYWNSGGHGSHAHGPAAHGGLAVALSLAGKPAYSREAVAALADGVKGAADPEWYTALVSIALDKTHDLAAAVKAADALIGAHPVRMSLDKSGHGHKGKGPGGGQFVKGEGGGASEKKTNKGANKETPRKPPAVKGAMTGARREGKGKEARVVLADGSPAPAHIKPSMVPPDWTDVRVGLDPEADVLVQARDNKGRPKTVYADKFHMRNAAIKFARTQAGLEARTGLIAENRRNLDSPDPKVREAAACTWLMQEQATRPGSDNDTGGKVKAYGATTLRAEHVEESEGGVRLHFIGKEGVEHNHLIKDPELAKELVRRKETAGERGGKLFGTDYDRVSAYAKTLDTGRFTPKDWRTQKANALAVGHIKSLPTPKTAKEYKASVKAVAEKVSSVLGNRPAQALESYIDPAVFSGWRVTADA